MSIMSNVLKRYKALFKISLKNELAYPTGVLLSSGIGMLELIVPIFVWLAIYTFSHVNVINGVNLSSTIIYFAVIGILMPLLGWSGIVNVISNDIENGSIISALIRPMSYFNQLIVGDLAFVMLSTVLVSIPVLILLIILAHLSITLTTILLFVLFVAIGYAIIAFLGFIMGLMAFYLTNIDGIIASITEGTYILGGGMLPLVFFPSYIEHVLLLTPFPFMAFVPSATLTGILSTSASESLIIVGLIWIVIFGILSHFLWKKVSKRINVVGI